MNVKRKNTSEKPDVSAKQKALDLLLYRTRTEKELYGKLLERGYSEEEAAEALEYVKSYGYVNDEDFARRFADSHRASQGRYSIRQKLREKGIDEMIINRILEELPDEEESVILELLTHKYGEPHKMEEKEFRRAYSFLVRRGFGSSGIIASLKEYQAE